MPIFSLLGSSIEVNRNSILLDTNVLVAAFDDRGENQDRHSEARYFLDEFNIEHQWIIPVAVVIEVWGMLAGARKNNSAATDFLAWLLTPGNALVLIPQETDLQQEYELVINLMVDCVDAIVVKLAGKITTECNLHPPLPIATYDSRDFYKLIPMLGGGKVSLFDIRNDEVIRF